MLRRLAAACAIVALSFTGVRAEPLPGFRAAHLRPSIETAEAGFWDTMDKAEAAVRRSAELNPDPALNAYVRGVLCRLAADYCDELRIYPLDRPAFNATAAPNGYVEVWSGLMLRAQTEDELAFVLGHEITHFGRNHTVQQFKNNKNTQNLMLVVRIGITAGAAAAMYSTASSGGPYAQQTIDSISQTAQAMNNLVYLAGFASIMSYGRDHETEADAYGFQLATAAGYDPAAGAEMWRALVAETLASDFPAVRKSESRASIFATHPLSTDRIAALSKLAEGAAPIAAADGRRKYRAAIRPHLSAWLRDDLRRRDFGQTFYILDRLSADGEDLGLIEFYRGECFRLRRSDGDQKLASAAYGRAVGHADAPSAAWRELGEARRKTGDRDGAAQAFADYLNKAPEAEDRWLVEATLKALRPEGPL